MKEVWKDEWEAREAFKRIGSQVCLWRYVVAESREKNDILLENMEALYGFLQELSDFVEWAHMHTRSEKESGDEEYARAAELERRVHELEAAQARPNGGGGA